MIRYCTILLIFFLFTPATNLKSQTRFNTDSLKDLLHKASGKEKLELYYKLAFAYSFSNAKITLLYCDSALNLTLLEKYPKILTKIYIEKVWALKNLSRYNESVEIAKKNIKLAQTNSFDKYLAEAYQSLAIVQNRLGQRDSAILNYQKAIAIYDSLGNYKSMGVIFNNMGIVYKDKGLYIKAINIYTQGQKCYEKANDLSGCLFISNNIGQVYLDMGDYDKAMKYFVEANEYAKQNEDLYNIANTANNIGLVYYYQKNWTKALKYFNISLEISTKQNDEWGILHTQNNIADVYLETGNYELVFEYSSPAIELSKKTNDFWGLAIAYKNIGLVFLKQNNPQKAIEYMKKAMEAAIIEDDNSLLVTVYNAMYLIQKELRQFEKALASLEKSKQLNDSITRKENIERVTQIQTEYETEKKNFEIKSLKHQNELKQIQIRKEETYRNALLVTVFLLIVIAVLLFLRFSYKRKANRILRKQNNEIEAQARRLENLNEELQKTNATKDKLFSIIAHDLKGPFQSILGFSDFLSWKFDTMDDTKKKEMVKNILIASSEAYNLLENLLNWSRTQLEKINVSPENHKLSCVVNEVIGLNQTRIIGKEITVENRIDDNIEAFFDVNMIETVIRNVLNNSIKFCNKGDSIFFSAKTTDKKVWLTIKDTGVGMPPEKVRSLFEIGKIKSTRGTKNEKGTGLGLIICKEFIEANNGEIEVKSSEGNGFEFSFSIPKNLYE